MATATLALPVVAVAVAAAAAAAAFVEFDFADESHTSFVMVIREESRTVTFATFFSSAETQFNISCTFVFSSHLSSPSPLLSTLFFLSPLRLGLKGRTL